MRETTIILFLLGISLTDGDVCVGDFCMDRVYQEVPDSIAHDLRVKRMAFYRSGAELEEQVSHTLDYLLDKDRYNKQMRPPGHPDLLSPVLVQINMAIRSMGPIDETREMFSLDCYFRQSWTDTRLSYNTTGVTELVLNWQFLTKIWKPDTTFLNGQKSYLHKITVPNRFIRISPQGRVSYSQRLTLWSRCPMYLGKFPLDSQSCKLEIGSYGYTGEDLSYVWAEQPLSMDELGLAQYHMTAWTYGVDTSLTKRKISSGFRNDSVAFLKFDFERQSGFFMLGIYFPLTLIVMCSWVSFWIVKTDVPSRVSLGITTVLSVTKVGFGGKAKPQIGYATALDIYIIICFFFTFASLTEFAIINFIDIYYKRLKKWEEDFPKLAQERHEILKSLQVRSEAMKRDLQHREPSPDTGDQEQEEEELNAMRKKEDILVTINEKTAAMAACRVDTARLHTKPNMQSEEMTRAPSTQPQKLSFREKVLAMEMRLRSLVQYVKRKHLDLFPVWRHLAVPGVLMYDESQYVVDRIDEVCRLLFPGTFLLTSLVYWTFYIYIARD